jgi:hypothetical protein
MNDPHIDQAIETAIDREVRSYTGTIVRNIMRGYGGPRNPRRKALVEKAKQRCPKADQGGWLLPDFKQALIEVIGESDLVDHLREKLRQRCYGANR